MKNYLLVILVSAIAVTPPLIGQTDTPPIPEEARRHFVMGSTLAENAKTAADFSKVVSEFKQAADLAPQLPQARYNLAKAREAAGDYSGAIADLKIYQQFKLSESEARNVQDKIYALEAKKQMKVSDGTAKAADDVPKETAGRSRFVKAIQGEWHVGSMYLSIIPLGNGNVTIKFEWAGKGAVSDIKITESTLRFTVIPATRVGNPETSWRFSLSLDNSGRLKGTSNNRWTQRGKEFARRLGAPDWNDDHAGSSDWVFTRP